LLFRYLKAKESKAIGRLQSAFIIFNIPDLISISTFEAPSREPKLMKHKKLLTKLNSQANSQRVNGISGIVLCLLLVSFSAFSTHAKKEIDKDSLRSYFPEINADSSSMIIPFNRVGNLIIVRAKVDTLEGNFILDTGASGLVLNKTYFRDYPVTGADEERTNVSGSNSIASVTTIGTLSLGDFKYHRLNADLENLGNIENAKGIKILGLLGVALFTQCEMIVDFENSQIHLTQVRKKDAQTYKHESLKDTSAYLTFPIEVSNNRILINTDVAGKKLKLVIDCAAESSMLDSRLPDRVFQEMSVVGKVKVVGPGNKKIDALLGNITNMKIGSYEMGNMLITVSNLERTCFSDGSCDGVLGFNFLSMHKIGFNFVTRKFYIWK
jgi:predicted aspartyl protease